MVEISKRFESRSGDAIDITIRASGENGEYCYFPHNSYDKEDECDFLRIKDPAGAFGEAECRLFKEGLTDEDSPNQSGFEWLRCKGCTDLFKKERR